MKSILQSSILQSINNKVISKLLAEFSIFTYHEDFINGQENPKSNSDYSGIRLATENDLPYIEKKLYKVRI